MYNDTGKLHTNELNILLFTYRNAVHFQTISNKNSDHACCVDVQLLASYQESLALLDLWLGVFLGDIDSGNAVSCTILIV